MTTSALILKEELEASNALYTGITPSDLTPLVINGVTYKQDTPDDGFFAQAFVDGSGNIILAFEGTTLDATSYGAHSLAADALLGAGGIPNALRDAQSFAQLVVTAHGSTANIYVTGHSLGGAEAEAAAAQFGFNGDTFGAPGFSITSAQQGSNQLTLTSLSAAEKNLTDYINWGDPVGNLGTDTEAGANYTPPGITHIGQVTMVGSRSEGAELLADGKLFLQNAKEMSFDALIGTSQDIIKAINLAAAEANIAYTTLKSQLPHHDLKTTYAPDLGYSIDNTSGIATLGGTVGPTVAAATLEKALSVAIPYSSFSDVITSGQQLQQFTITDTDNSYSQVNLDISGTTSFLTNNHYTSSGQLQATAQVNDDGSESDTLYNLSGGSLADQVLNYDTAGNLTSTKVVFTNGNSITLDTGTVSGLSYNSSTNTLTGTLMANGNAIGTLSLAAAGGGTVTLIDGPNILGTRSIPISVPATGNMHLATTSSGTSSGQAILNYLAALGDPLTGAQLDHIIRDTQSPPTSTTTVTGTVDAAGDAGYVSGHWDTFFASTENVTATGPTSVVISGTSQPVTNILRTSGHNISQDTLSNIQVLDIAETSTSTGILMTGAELNSFQRVISPTGQGYAEVIDSGSYSMVGKFDDVYGLQLAAGSSQGTTLTGWNLAASMYGSDTLIGHLDSQGVAAGGYIRLLSGKGIDTLQGGSAGNTQFGVQYGLAAGSVVEGFGSGNQLIASGDISQATITGVQLLNIGATLNNLSVTLTANQFNSFSTIAVVENLGAEIDVVGGGTVSLLASNVTQASFVSGSSLKAVSDEGTTLIGNNSNGITLTASQFGNDTLKAGNGNSDVLNAGGGSDILVAGTGTDTMNGGTGYAAYQFGSTFGADTINNAFAGATAANGEIDFASASGVTLQKLWFTQSGSNLVIRLLGTSDTITVTGWFGSNTGAQVSSINTADGFTLSNSAVSALVTAMANYQSAHSSFNPATATSMPTDTTLQAALSTAWPIDATNITIANAQAHQTSLDTLAGGYSIVDTATNVAANLTFLTSDAAHISAITLADVSTPTLTLSGTLLNTDAAALKEIASSYNVAVTGGGTITMSNTITNAPTLNLQTASSAYNFTANNVRGLVINDTGTTGGDTINAITGDTVNIGSGSGMTNEDYVNISGGAVTLANNAWADIYGGSNAITLGQNVTVGVQSGNGNAITAHSGTTIYLNSGTGDVVTTPDGNVTVYASSGVSFSVVGGGNGGILANGDTISISGNGQYGNSNYFTLSSGTVNVANSSRADIYGGNDAITVGDNALLGIQNGNSNAISVGTGASAYSGSAVYVNSGTGDVLTGNGFDTYADAGVSVSVVGSRDSVYGADGDIVSLSGNGQYGDGNYVHMNNGTINLAANTHTDVFGGGNAITAGASTLIGIQDGNSNTLTVGANSTVWVNNGSGDILTLTGTGSEVDLATGVSNISINASHATINAANGDMFNVTGSYDTVVASSAIIYLNASTTNITIQGNNDVVHIRSGDTYTLTGTGNTVITDTVVTASNGSTIASYNGNSTLVDITGLSFDSSITTSIVQNSGGYAGQMKVYDHGSLVDTINLSAVSNLASITVRPDGSGGTLIVDPPLDTTAPASTKPDLDTSHSLHQAFVGGWSALMGGTQESASSSHVPTDRFDFAFQAPNTTVPEAHRVTVEGFSHLGADLIRDGPNQHVAPMAAVADQAHSASAPDYANMKFDFSSLPTPPASSSHFGPLVDVPAFLEAAGALVEHNSVHELAQALAPTEPDHFHHFDGVHAPEGWHL